MRVKKVKPGMREAELAAEIDYQMRRLGAESCRPFETIVAAGAVARFPMRIPVACHRPE